MITPTVGQVVQFNEKHKWRGAFGFVEEVKMVKTEGGGVDYRIMIGATMPNNQTHCDTAHIFSMLSKNEFDLVGEAALMPPEEVEDE